MTSIKAGARPLEFQVLGRLQIPVPSVHGMQDVAVPVARNHELPSVITTTDTHMFNQCFPWSQVDRASDLNPAI